MTRYDQEHPSRDDAPIATAKNLDAARELVSHSVTINRPVDEVYAFVRAFDRLPRIFRWVSAIDPYDTHTSTWTLQGKSGELTHCTVRISEEIAGQSFTWQSEDDAEIASSGKVAFNGVAGRGTVVTVTAAYDRTSGFISRLMANFTKSDPGSELLHEMRRLKQYLETGEIATGARNPKIAAETRGDY